MALGLLNIGPFEVLLLVAVAVMLFGGDLPDAARKAGRLMAKLRATASELGRAVYQDGDPRAELPPRLPDSRRPPESRIEPPDEVRQRGETDDATDDAAHAAGDEGDEIGRDSGVDSDSEAGDTADGTGPPRG